MARQEVPGLLSEGENGSLIYDLGATCGCSQPHAGWPVLSMGGPLLFSLPRLAFLSRCHSPPPSLAGPPRAAKQRRRAELSRALALSRSRALVLACLLLSLNSAAKLVLFAQDSPKKQRFYCSRAHIYLISLPPSPFPLCPASSRPRQQRAEMTRRGRLWFLVQ